MKKPSPYTAIFSKAKKQVLFLCTANYYRSRLAEILFNYYASCYHLPWQASSGALIKTNVTSISPFALRYLESKGIALPPSEPRDPEFLESDRLLTARLIIAMNRAEHELIITDKYTDMAKSLEKEGKLLYWNIYDIPPDIPWYQRISTPISQIPCQLPESSSEHIDFAVQALIQELCRV